MDASESSTLAKEDEDALNLWQTLRRDLSLQNMPPLVTDLDGSDGDDSSFVIASQDFSEEETLTHQ